MRNSLMTNWMQEMDEMMFGKMPARSEVKKSWFSPSVDIQETEKEYLLQFDLPGMTEKELNIQVAGRELHLSGERKQEASEKESRIHRSERFFGRFERSFLLPEEANLNQIDAAFKDGVLEVKVPKIEAVQPKTIPIRTH